MHCSKCGENIPTAAKFCPSCGEPISVNTSSHMSCKNCGASLEIDDKSIVFCPYCGSKEIIIDSDDVKIQKIDLEKEKAKLDFELTRQKNR